MPAYWGVQGESKSLVGVVFFIWLVLVSCVFWLFQFQHSSTWVSFEGDKLPSFGGQLDAIKVVHFVDEGCPCSKFSAPHIERLEERWATNKIHFVSVQAHKGVPLAAESVVNPLPKSQVSGTDYHQYVPASPSVAVWDEAGDLIYFGPYTAGAVCGEGEDLLSKVLTSVQNGVVGQWTNSEAVGCFCEWPSMKLAI